ncbi:MAG: PAS domain-containing sensor histidine kinase [Dehalococcoidia bacterium]|nr:PAS domain-containing sensor histidine kinase [Dehalococcoidia bacterium]
MHHAPSSIPDRFRRELDLLEVRVHRIARRAGTARDADALRLLRAAIADLDQRLRDLRDRYVEDARRRTEAEEALRRGEYEFQRLLDELPCAAWRTDADGTIRYVNGRWREYAGYDAAQTAARWDSIIHEDDKARTGISWFAARAAGESWQAEHRLRRHDGVFRWHLTRAHPVRDAGGRISEWVATSADIHDLKEDDLRNQRLYDDARHVSEQLVRTVETKDEFLGLISHELKTPITTILGNAEVLLRRHEQLDPAARSEALSDIHRDASRLHRIVEDLLSLARIEGGQPADVEPLLLGHVIAHVIAEHQQRYPARIVEAELAPEPPPVLGARGYVEQVVRNLLSTAEKYSPPELPISVVLRSAGREVEVIIGDRGGGAGRGGAHLRAVRPSGEDGAPGQRQRHRPRRLQAAGRSAVRAYPGAAARRRRQRVLLRPAARRRGRAGGRPSAGDPCGRRPTRARHRRCGGSLARSLGRAGAGAA